VSTSKFEDHLWRELLREHGDDLAQLNRPATGNARPRPRLVSGAGVLFVAAAVIIVVATTLVTFHSPSAKPRQTTTTSAPNSTAAQWELVGDVLPSWHAVGSLSSNPGLSLTCPSAETCFAADSPGSGGVGLSAVEVTHDGGGTWTSSKLPVALLGLSVPLLGQTRIVCADARTCAILGLSGSVSCPTAQGCTLRNPSATFEETTDGGKSWIAHAGPPGLKSLVGVSAMACASASSCLAVAEGYGPAASYATSDGGESWTTAQLPTGFVPHDLQCPSTTKCVVTGYDESSGGSQVATVLYTTDAGAIWTTATLPSGLGSLGTVSCATATDCLATFNAADGHGSEVVSSTDGGASWSSVPASGLPEGVVLSTACPAADHCWAAGVTDANVAADGMTIHAGAAALLASTSNGGRTWQSTTAPDGVSLVASLSCPSTAKCYALAFAKPAGRGFISVVLLSYGH
jgi:photosystem II stability/assembly factor-like uncharacterized protein